MIKAEKNVPIVGIEAHGEKVETTIRGNYVDVVALTVTLLSHVSKALSSDDIGDQASTLQALYLTALDDLRKGKIAGGGARLNHGTCHAHPTHPRRAAVCGRQP